MPNLAGFDLIIEVARMALERELLNTPIATGPTGPANDTLVPPFMLSRNIPLPGLTGLLSLKVTDLRLIAQAGTPLVTLSLVFEDGAIQAPGLAVSMLGGQGSVTAPLYFTPAPPAKPGQPPSVSNLAVDFTQATSLLQLDAASSSRLDKAAGAALGASIRSALTTALTALFKNQGVVNLGFSFAVDSSRDSSDMMILSAVPLVSWIDGESLGIFGYHRQAANTGATALKIASDLPPAPYPGFPWYPVSILLSPFSFQRLIACPSIRSAARDHVAGRYRDDWINQARDNDHNWGPATPGEIQAVDDRLKQYLDSPAGQAEIAGCTPAPCGNGQIDQKIKIPGPFSDTTGYINWISMELGQGQVEVMAKAHALIFCGKVTVELPMSLKPSVGRNGQIIPGPIAKGQPKSDVPADPLCKLAAGAMTSFLGGPLIGSVVALVGAAVAESLAETLVNSEILKQDLPAPKMGGAGPKLPAGVRLKGLEIEPSGLVVQGVWDGMVKDPRKYDPSVHLYWETDHQEVFDSGLRPGTFEDDCGGGPRTFRYVPHAWNTIVKFRIEVGDVPQPVRYDDWWLWLDGVAHKLTAGSLVVPGQVVVPQPPDKSTVEERSQIVIDVQGAPDKGFTLAFRYSDANVPFELDTRVIDGSGRSWSLGTNNQQSQGLTFGFDQEYLDFKEECARHIIGVAEKYKLAHEVSMLDKVASINDVVESRLLGAVRDEMMGGAAAIRQLMTEQPEIAKQFFRET